MPTSRRALSRSSRSRPYPYVRLTSWRLRSSEAPAAWNSRAPYRRACLRRCGVPRRGRGDSSGGLAALCRPIRCEFVTAHGGHQWGMFWSAATRVPFADEALTQYSAMLTLPRIATARIARAKRRDEREDALPACASGRADGRRWADVVLSPLAYAGLVWQGPYFYDPLTSGSATRRFFQALRRTSRASSSVSRPRRRSSISWPSDRAARRALARWLRERTAMRSRQGFSAGHGGVLGGQGGTPDLSQLMEELMKQLGSGTLP